MIIFLVGFSIFIIGLYLGVLIAKHWNEGTINEQKRIIEFQNKVLEEKVFMKVKSYSGISKCKKH